MSIRQGIALGIGVRIANALIDKGKEKLDERRKRLKEKSDRELEEAREDEG